MFRIIFYIFLIYLGYQFIVNFLFPVVKTAQQVRKGFRAMQDQVNKAQSETQSSAQQQAGPSRRNEQEAVGDYIEFEEIK